MYQIQPYDLSEAFNLIPYGEKYQLTLWHRNSVSFKSKRKAFEFISAISTLFNEVISIVESVVNTCDSYKFHLVPNFKSIQDSYNIFYENSRSISETLRDLKYFKKSKTELYRIVLAIDNLLTKVLENIKILNTKNKNCVKSYELLIKKIIQSLNKILSNSLHHFENKSLTLFK